MNRPRLNFKMAIDAANSAIKVACEGYEDKIASYIDYRCNPSDTLGNVVIKGDKDDVFCVGYGASKSPTGKATVSDKSTKINEIEKLYLGALSYCHSKLAPQSTTIKNHIVISSHAWQSHKEVIKSKLERSIDVVLAGKPIELTTEVLAVVPEGFGVVVTHGTEKFVTLDFGSGTTILTPYINKKPQESQVTDLGVNQLYVMIQSAMKSQNYGYTGDLRKIREQIENGKFIIDGCNIKDVYNQCLKQWWNDGLKEYAYEAQRLASTGYTVLCIGGGVALPGFSKVLESKKLASYQGSPEMASVKGMYQLCETLGVKKGV